MQHHHVESHALGCRQAVNHHAQRILGQRQVDERIEERCHGRAVRCQADDFLLALAGSDLRCRQPRRFGLGHADTHSVDESRRQCDARPARTNEINSR
jgi:hypothetical protein